MIEISDHACKEMDEEDISEEEVRWCIERGELEIKQFVEGEMRYGKRLDTKEKTIIIIYTYRGKTTRIITCYTIRRKKWQSQ